ncbi:hypothetical protein J7I97_35220 [Streptomyces sp. ISL-87]|nr:hypothetical protein [Streptomyces sp. ISL-21]MBT2613326.1 hypothetical protein [Streptomyces sp. ISL-87]
MPYDGLRQPFRVPAGLRVRPGYHSTSELTMPKSSRVASRMSASARRSPSACAAPQQVRDPVVELAAPLQRPPLGPGVAADPQQ